jgi:threonine dehydrogenase-like Zn-dependent dehydrogenase
MAKAFGARFVTLVGATPERLEVGAGLGADLTIDVRDGDVATALARHGPSALPSVILEATGNPASIVQAVKTVAPGGRIVLQGIFSGQQLDGLDLDRIVIGEVTLHGALGSPGVWPYVIRLVESGQIDPGALVTAALPLGSYHRVLERVKNRTGIKTIIRADAYA